MSTPTIIRHAASRTGFVQVITLGMRGYIHLQAYTTHANGTTQLDIDWTYSTEEGAIQDFHYLLTSPATQPHNAKGTPPHEAIDKGIPAPDATPPAEQQPTGQIGKVKLFF